MAAPKKWSDLLPDEKRRWFENSYRMHQDLPTQKQKSIYKKIEAERQKKERRKARRKPKWWQRKK